MKDDDIFGDEHFFLIRLNQTISQNCEDEHGCVFSFLGNSLIMNMNIEHFLMGDKTQILLLHVHSPLLESYKEFL